MLPAERRLHHDLGAVQDKKRPKTVALRTTGKTLIVYSVIRENPELSSHEERHTMTPILQFLKSLLPVAESQRDRDEAYLAESVDIHDLERRMRSIDERGRNRNGGIALGLYAR